MTFKVGNKVKAIGPNRDAGVGKIVNIYRYPNPEKNMCWIEVKYPNLRILHMYREQEIRLVDSIKAELDPTWGDLWAVGSI